MSRFAVVWRWLWTEAVALAAASFLPSRDAVRVEEWILRRRNRPDAEGDTPASITARRTALARLFHELHTKES